MPYRRKRKRTYKRRTPYRMRMAAKRRAYRAKRARKYRVAINRLQGRTLSYRKIFKIPGTYKNQTIQYCVNNETEFNTYVQPSDFATDKVDVVTNLMFPTLFLGTNTNDSNIQQCFENTGNPPVIQDFVTFRKLFAWSRFKWIRVTLIPENYMAVSTGESTIGDTPTHPTLHVINDNGESALALGRNSQYSVDDARTLPKYAYTEHYFNKPHRFYINLVQRNDVISTGVRPYTSAKTWVPQGSANFAGVQLIPVDNFYYGFTNVPTGFKFAVKLEACVVGKQLRIADNVATFSVPSGVTPATNQEEKKPDKGGGAQ